MADNNGNGGTTKLPTWLVNSVITAALGFLTISIVNLNATLNAQARQITTLEANYANIEKSLIEIKSDTKETKELVVRHMVKDQK